jgi:hypothetical protein
VSTSLWSPSGSLATRLQQERRAEAVWVAPLDESRPPRRIFDIPPASRPGAASDPERIVDLTCTPDWSRLVAITRQVGPPARSRVFVVDVTDAGGAVDHSETANELVLLPAAIVPGSAVPDPSGR